MIKPLNTIQLSSAKPRTGLQSIADLLPKLIRQYEIQAEVTRRRDSQQFGLQTESVQEGESGLPTQVTFSWYR